MKRNTPATDEAVPGAKQVSDAYRKLPGSTVPPELDARVLDKARAAAEQSKSNKITWLNVARMRRLSIPLAAAASVIMVISVVYEMRFNTPHDTVSIQAPSSEQAANASLAEERKSAATGERKATLAKPAGSRAQPMADAAARPIAPPPVKIGPSAPVIAPLTEAPISPPAMAIAMPLPSASPSPSVNAVRAEADLAANESPQEKKPSDFKAAYKAEMSDAAQRAKSSGGAASGQLLGATSKLAEERPSFPALKLVAGHYKYDSYRIIMLSGQSQGLKDLGYAAATLDIDAQGTVTRRVTMENGATTTQTAKVLAVKLDGNSGYWTLLWSDMNYPVESTILFDASKLTSRTQFEELSDSVRFGNVELATLRRLSDR